MPAKGMLPAQTIFFLFVMRLRGPPSPPHSCAPSKQVAKAEPGSAQLMLGRRSLIPDNKNYRHQEDTETVKMETASIPDSLQFSEAPLGCLFTLLSLSTSVISWRRYSFSHGSELDGIPAWISVLSKTAH